MNVKGSVTTAARVLGILLWMIATLAADQPELAKNLRAQGLELGYNLDHDDALSAFRAAIAADPTDPAGYRLVAATEWIRLLFRQGAIMAEDFLGQAQLGMYREFVPVDIAASFHENLERAQALSEARLLDNPNDANAHFQNGAAAGFRASYTATIEGRIVAAFVPARRAYHEHERVLQMDPTRKDAGLIVGMYRYAVSALSAPKRLLAHLAGFGGGRERGLRLVEEASLHPSDVQTNALFTLIVMYNREARYGDALRVIGALQRRYPRNRLLWLEAGSTALRAGRLNEARSALEAGLSMLAVDARPRAVGEEVRWRFTYGATLVAMREIEPAERELNAALAAKAPAWVRARIFRELGKVADLRGERTAAIEKYRMTVWMCDRLRDESCVKDARTLMKRGYR